MDQVNKRSIKPFSQEMIYYLSRVMDRLNDPTTLFEQTKSGQLQNRVMSLKLLEAGSMRKKQQKRILQDVGESALLLCGFFHRSLENRLVDIEYYQKMGATAYIRLNKIVPEFFDIPSFYRGVGTSFKVLTDMMTVVARDFFDGSAPPTGVVLIVNSKEKLPKAS
ncbi:MAG: hypothetical protein HN730_05750 [Bdellovibrionales bacterium]|jgi:hypothetical protein|nr:hypothetical protein [Bdellovibrionales bacterium]